MEVHTSRVAVEPPCECCGAITDDIEGCVDADDADVYVMLCGECRRMLSVEQL